MRFRLNIRHFIFFGITAVLSLMAYNRHMGFGHQPDLLLAAAYLVLYLILLAKTKKEEVRQDLTFAFLVIAAQLPAILLGEAYWRIFLLIELVALDVIAILMLIASSKRTKSTDNKETEKTGGA